MTDATIGDKSLRAKEKLLDQKASTLDRETDVSFRDAVRIIVRCWDYFRLFPGRIAVKFALSAMSIVVPLLLMPWPIKIIVDHVILAQPIARDDSGFPFYLEPFVFFLDGKTPVQMMLWVVLFSGALALLFGAFGQSKGAIDAADASMAEGQDTATQSENEANQAISKLGGLLGVFDLKLHMRLAQSLNHIVRSKLFESIKSLPMTQLDDQPIGDSVYRVMYDSTAISTILYQMVISPLLTTTTIVTAVLVMFTNYGSAPEIVATAALMVPLMFLATAPFSRMARRRSQASRAAGSATTGNVEEGMSNVLAVQSLGVGKQEGKRFHKASNESFKRYRGAVLVALIYGQTGKLGGTLGAVIIFLVMSRRVIDGTFSTGDYFVVMYYYGWLSGAMSSIPYLWIRSQGGIAGMRRVFFLMDLPSEKRGDGVELPPISRGVVMRGAGLTYPDGRRALHQVDLDLRVGEIVAIVGPTGAGKTSLAYLIPAFHQATEGSVSIDGVDVADASVTSLRSQISYVFQEPQLSSDSILDNIRYGSHEASREDVERVARIAGAHDFILGLPGGYDTKLGTVTSKVSVGQKQRIAIARGLLRDARILILDEPTSALDPETEEYLVAALDEAAKDRLVVIIAHRLSTIAHADRIVFLDDGEIREQGSHTELMARPDGHYREFVRLQSGAS